MAYNYRCLLPLIKYLSYLTLCSHVYEMSKLGQLRTCLSLMTIRRNSCSTSFQAVCEEFGFYIRLSSYYECTCLHIARTCYIELHRMASISRFMTSTATATLVSAFVLSKIESCNLLLFGSTHDVTYHLRLIQNYAARVILHLPKSSSMTIHLKSLHWLPVRVRSTYKIACLCYHCHSNAAPSYVADMLQKK